MMVKELDARELSLYDSLSSELGTLFNCRQWLKMFGNDVQILGVYNKSNELIGGITIGVKRKFGLKILLAQPLAPGTGPFYKSVANGAVKKLEERRDVVEALAKYIDEQRFAVVSFVFSPKMTDTLPFVWRDYKVVTRYTYRLDLSKSEEEFLKNMSGDTRNMIRKADKDGLRCERVTDMTDVISLMSKTFARQKMTFAESQDRRVLFEYANPGNSAAFVTYLDGKPSAAVFTVRDDRTCYYLMGGYDDDNKHNGAGPLALFKAILQAKSDGCDVFDFEGSIVPQIEKYFRGFGGELTPYFVANKAWLPIEMVLKLFKRRMF